MSVVPTGLPAWTRTASIESYGGNTEKRNYGGGGVIDATTDVGAEDFSRMVADLAAAVRTAPKCVITYLNNDSSPAAPTIESVMLMTGVNLVSYSGASPPSGYPQAARNGNGDVTLTFDESYLDDYGVEGSFELLSGDATCHGSSPLNATVDIVDPQNARVRCFNGASAVSNARVTVVLY